jgi:predicted MFS family arabinose efflux permease
LRLTFWNIFPGGGVPFFGINLLIPGLLIAQLLMRRTVPEAYGLNPDGDRPAEGQRVAGSVPAALPAPVSAKGIRNDSRFWMLALCHGTAVMVALMAFVHQVPYAIDNGIEKVAAATSLGAMGFAGLVGQFFFGWVSDRIGDPKYSAALGYTFMAAGTVSCCKPDGRDAAGHAVVFGFGYGPGALLPIIAADRWPSDHGRGVQAADLFVVGVGVLGPLVGG